MLTEIKINGTGTMKGKVVIAYETRCSKCGGTVDYYRELCARCELSETRKTTQQSMKDRKAHPCLSCPLMQHELTTERRKDNDRHARTKEHRMGRRD
jgi:hypothetical protein